MDIRGDSQAPEKAAPALYREFNLTEVPTNAVWEIAVVGWCEVRVNGKRLGEAVLAPVTGQPDKRVSSLSFPLTGVLREGTNSIEVLLGNGWFNTFTKCDWGFEKAPWVSAPKICGAVRGRREFRPRAGDRYRPRHAHL